MTEKYETETEKLKRQIEEKKQKKLEAEMMAEELKNAKKFKKRGWFSEKEFADEIAEKLNDLKRTIAFKADLIKSKQTKETLASIVYTLSKMVKEVEQDPKDRNKVRKLANHYSDLILELIDKYVEFEKKADMGISGGNIETGRLKIEENLRQIDAKLKKTLDDMFQEDAFVVNADINTLEKLMHLKPEEKPAEEQDIRTVEEVTETAVEEIAEDTEQVINQEEVIEEIIEK